MTSVVMGVFLLLAVVPASHAGNFFDVSDNGNVGIGTASAGALLDVARPATTSNTEMIDIRANGFTQTIASGLTNARFNLFNQYTLSAATAQTVTNGTTLHIAGPPSGGGPGPATITTSSALRIAAGSVANTTNAYGLYVDAPTGATNNYAAAFPTGNVGIGTTNPGAIFQVSKNSGSGTISADAAAAILIKSTTNAMGLRIGVDEVNKAAHIQSVENVIAPQPLILNSGGGNVILNPVAGNVGIGTTSPSWKLDVTGNARVTGPLYYSSPAQASLGYYLCWNASSWEVTYGGSCAPSSRRFKEKIADLNYGLAEIARLRPISFTYKPEYKLGSDRQLGFIAEEVGAVLPEVVAYEPNGRDAKSIDYGRLTAVLVQAIKEQQVQIRELQKEIAALKHSQ